MTEQQIVNLGREAANVLDNEAYKQAMTALKVQIETQWRECPIRDQEGQMLLLQMRKIADKFEGVLYGMIQNGTAAQHKIDINSARNEGKARSFMRRVID